MSNKDWNPKTADGDNIKRPRSCWRVNFYILLAVGMLVAVIAGIKRSLDTCGWLDIKLNRSSCQAAYKIGDGNLNAGLAISGDGEILAALDSTNLMIVESQTGKVRSTIALRPSYSHVSISSDGKFAGVITDIGLKREIRILTTESGETIPVEKVAGTDFHPYFLFIPSTNDFYYTAVRYGSDLGIYKLNVDANLSEYLLEAYGPLFFSPDGKIMGTGGLTGVQLWNMQDGSPSLIQTIPIPVPVTAAALSPDGKKLAVAGGYAQDSEFSQTVSIWNIPSGELDRNIKKPRYFSYTPRLSFSPDSALLAVVACEGSLYQVSDGTVLERIKRIGTQWFNMETSGCVSDIVFSPAGDVLYYGSNWKLVEWKVPSY